MPILAEIGHIFYIANCLYEYNHKAQKELKADWSMPNIEVQLQN